MKKAAVTICLLYSCTVASAQQQKNSLYKNYHFGINTAILKGSGEEKATIAAFADAGRSIRHNFIVGAGAGFLDFQNEKKATAVYAYGEKNTGGKNRQLFVYVKPGLAFAYQPQMQLQNIDRFEYFKRENGLFIQSGVGIKWMVNRHSFFLGTGVSRLSYKIYSKEHPVPVDPYDPFMEAAIVHQYKFVFSKLLFNMGFTF